MVQFHVLDLIIWNSVMPRLILIKVYLLDKIASWTVLERNCNTFFWKKVSLTYKTLHTFAE